MVGILTGQYSQHAQRLAGKEHDSEVANATILYQGLVASIVAF